MSNDVPPLDGPAVSSPQMSPAGPMGVPSPGEPDPVRSGASAAGAPSGTTDPTAPKSASGEPSQGRKTSIQRALVGLGVVIVVAVAFIAGRTNDGSGTANQNGGADTTAAPGTTVSPEDTMPSNMLDVALQFHNQGRFDDAIRAYEAVLRVDPTNKFAFYNIGVIQQSRKQFDQAIGNYDKVLALDSNFNPARYNRGLAHRDTNQIDKAIADLEAVLEADEDNASAMWNLGNIYVAEGRTEEGSKLIADALVINPALEQSQPAGSS